jgi:hypothetical protein
VDVLEGQTLLVPMDDAGGDFTRGDLAEKTVGHPSYSFPMRHRRERNAKPGRKPTPKRLPAKKRRNSAKQKKNTNPQAKGQSF